jgi:hypothetical protein
VITEKVVRGVVRPSTSEQYENDNDILSLLLNQRGSEVKITDEVVKAAAGKS